MIALIITFQLYQLYEVIDNLRDTVLDLEVTNVDSLKDVSMLESRLRKYQCHFSLSEVVKARSYCFAVEVLLCYIYFVGLEVVLAITISLTNNFRRFE